MKKIIIALALVVVSYSGAEAQTKSAAPKETCKCATIAKKVKNGHGAYVHHHGSGSTYQVCVEKDGHYQCCVHHKKVTTVAAQ
jgi:hypothetical protein